MELRSYKTNKYKITRELRKNLKIFEENNSNMTRKERCIHIKKMFDIILTNASWTRRNKEFYDTVKDKFTEFSMYKEFIEIHTDKQLKTYINFFDLTQSVEEMKRPLNSSSDVREEEDRETPSNEESFPHEPSFPAAQRPSMSPSPTDESLGEYPVAQRSLSSRARSGRPSMSPSETDESLGEYPGTMSSTMSRTVSDESSSDVREEEQQFQLPQVLGVRRVYGMNSNERQTLQDFQRRVDSMNSNERQTLQDFQREAEEYFEREMEQHFLESNFTSNSWVDWSQEQIMRDQDEQILREEPRHQELNYQRPINTLFSFQYTSPLIPQNIPNPFQENIYPRTELSSRDERIAPILSQTLQSANHPEVDDNKAEENEKKCIVCQDNKPCVINTRCGHYICCGSCSSNIFSSKNNKCPICREKWDSIIKVFQ